MNILFVSLEESGKKISDKILKDLDNQNLNHNYYSFGLDQQATFNIKEVNEIKIKPIMGFFQVVKNLRYIFNTIIVCLFGNDISTQRMANIRINIRVIIFTISKEN